MEIKRQIITTNKLHITQKQHCIGPLANEWLVLGAQKRTLL